MGRDPVPGIVGKDAGAAAAAAGAESFSHEDAPELGVEVGEGDALDRGGRVQDTASLSNPAKREGKKRWGSPGSENRTFWRGVSSTVSGGLTRREDHAMCETQYL